jgi:AraC family transcriptional regulator
VYAPNSFDLCDTHGMLAQPGARIRACSDGRGWTSLFASVQQEMPFQGMFGASPDQLLVLHRSGPVQVKSLSNSGIGRCTVPAGAIHLISSGSEFGIQLSAPVETVHVYIRRAIIEEVAQEIVEGDPAEVCIRNQVSELDPGLSALINSCAHAAEDGNPGTGFFVDYLARAIAGHLIRRYSTNKLKGLSAPSPRASLSPSVVAAIDHMTENLDRQISLQDIARVSSRSASHISRMFRLETGMPPHRYLVNLRIEKALRLLEKSNMSIVDIAFTCGFAHQEHMTQLFRRHNGTTPAAYRRSHRHGAVAH